MNIGEGTKIIITECSSIGKYFIHVGSVGSIINDYKHGFTAVFKTYAGEKYYSFNTDNNYNNIKFETLRNYNLKLLYQ